MTDQKLEKKDGNLVGKLALGMSSAALVSIPLSMGVTVFDRSVIMYANRSAPSLGDALFKGFANVLKSPISCFIAKDNLSVFAVYGSTYLAKNSAEIVSGHYGVNSFWPVFISSTLVNSFAGIMKDRFLATLFGKGSATQFPISSYITFGLRDCVIVGASFNGPRLISPILEKECGMSQSMAKIVAQIACPAAAQIVGTPLHLLGLDFYNRQHIPLVPRIIDAIRLSQKPVGARMVRQAYVFGIGSITIHKVNELLGL